MKTLQAMAAQQQLRASVEELSRECMSYTAVAAATMHELQQNMVSNYMKCRMTCTCGPPTWSP
eukprot:659176-Lingulodinium_polyedra.AAC.1